MIKGHKIGIDVLDSVPVQKWNDNYCLYFDGVNDYVKTQLVLFQQADYTMEVWIKDFGAQPAAANNQNLIWFTSFARLHILNNNSFVFLITTSTGTITSLTVGYPVGLNTAQWTHCLLRYTAATKTKDMFINGLLVGTQSISPSIPKQSNGSFVLGIGGNFSSNAWKGKMSEFRFYLRALSNSEITFSYNSGTPQLPQSQTGLAHWYAFENKSQNLGSLGSQYSPQLFNFSGNYYLPR